MNRGVCVSLEERGLYLLHERALAAESVQGHLGQSVASRAHDDGLDDKTAMTGFERRRHQLRLPTGQRRPPGSQSQMATRGPAWGLARHGLEVEEDAKRLDQALSPGGAGSLLQQDGRLVENLGQDRPRQGIHPLPLGIRELARAPSASVELSNPNLFET